MSAPIRLALVGMGKIAHDQHVPAIAGNADIALAATVSRTGEGGARRLDAGSVAGMPAGEEADVRRIGGGLQLRDLGQRRARRLFEEDVPALRDRLRGDDAADLRRGAERHRVDRDPAGDQIGQLAEMRDAVHAFAVAADGGGERDRGIAGDGGDVLVVGDLAHADERQTDRRAHSAVTVTGAAGAVASGLRNGSVKGAASITKTSPSRVCTPSAQDSVAVPKKWTWTSPARRKGAYLK